MIDTTLNTLVERFLPPCDLYYFEADHIHRYLIEAGIPVYTREEFSRSFPRFSLDYGAVYHMFDLAIPEVPWVTLLDAAQWRAIGPALQADLMASQIRCGRGNVYDPDWFGNSDWPVNGAGCRTFGRISCSKKCSGREVLPVRPTPEWVGVPVGLLFLG